MGRGTIGEGRSVARGPRLGRDARGAWLLGLIVATLSSGQVAGQTVSEGAGARATAAGATTDRGAIAPYAVPRSVNEAAPESSQRPAESWLLMRALGLEDAPVKLHGWLQNSYTGNTNGRPPSGTNFSVWPNHLADRWMGNQYYLILEKPAESGAEPSLGFRYDVLFGNDWQWTKSYGLFDRAFTLNSFAGLDFPQIYGDLHLPILTEWGVDIRGGRFYSPAGFEGVQATKRPLLSAPYTLTYTPFTFLGMLSTIHLRADDKLNVYAGTVNGWDRWFNTSYRWSVLGGYAASSASGRTTLSTFFLLGPDQLPSFPPIDTPQLPTGLRLVPDLAGRRHPGYARNWRLYFSNTLTHQWSDRVTQALQADQVFDPGNPGFGPGGGPRDTSWFSVAHWLLLGLDGPVGNANRTAVWRAEAFWDPQGAATGAPGTYFEMTLGLLLKPQPWLWVRPEARYDWVNQGRPFNDGTRSSQLTLAIDAVFLF